ncbi:MAG: hypothetical protein H6723_13380 [Sandaracinus sp.]|nr:hypothetical protein [Sandaracinus sp.]
MVDGYALSEQTWSRDEPAIRNRASFDFECPPDQLTLRVLDVANERYARQVGVTGCGRRAVYVDPRMDYMWVANSIEQVRDDSSPEPTP